MATLVIFANAVGLLLFFRGRADRLLSAVVDPLHPDWSGMQRAFAGFTLYAVSLLAVLALAILALAVRLWRARPGRDSTPAMSWRRRIAAHAVLAIAITSAVVLVFIEVLIFQDYGIHFYEFDVAGILADAALRRDLGIQPAEVARVTAAAIALLAAELMLCFAAATLADWRRGSLVRACGAAMLMGVPGGLALFRAGEEDVDSGRSELEAALPLGRLLLLRDGPGAHIAVEPRLGADGYAVIPDGRSFPVIANRSNLVFFVPDGLRADMMRADLTPNLLAFAARPDAIHSRRHYSSGHVSEAGIFGLLYGVDAHAYNAFISARVAPYPLEVLRRNGYHTFFISSSRLNPYPTDQLIRSFDEVAYPPNDDEAMRLFREYVERRRADGRPYFVLAFLYTPHFPFTSAKPHLRRFPMVGPKARPNYMNDVIQTDDYFRQALAVVRQDVDAGRTAIVATSDHGEEIRDHGVFGHASATFWNEKVQVPLIMALPGLDVRPSVKSPELTSHVDVWPTLFDYLGVAPRPDARRYSDGRSLLTVADRARPVVVTGRFFPHADRPSALVTAERKYWFRVPRAGPEDRLCIDVIRTTDLNDQAVRDTPADPRRLAAFESLQSTFWRFIRHTGPQTAPCPAD